jgi:hypothetical protein
MYKRRLGRDQLDRSATITASAHMRKSVIVVLPLVLLSGMFADGSAHAQCAAKDKIYIDPRLVPKRGNMTPEQLKAIMLSPGIPPEARNYLLEQ